LVFRHDGSWVTEYRPGFAALPDAISVHAGIVRGVPETFSRFQARVKRQFQALAAIHPTFDRLVVMSDGNCRDVASGLGDLDAALREACGTSRRRDDLVDAGPAGQLLPTTMHRLGFRVSMVVGASAADVELDEPRRQHVIATLYGLPYTAEPASSTQLEFPVASPWTDPELLRRLLAALLDAGGGNQGAVYRQYFRFRQHDEHRNRAHVDWMSYVCRPSVLAALSPHVGRVRFGAGELIVTSPHLPDPESAADVAVAMRTHAALADVGLLDWADLVIHGWPPDEEEWRYEELISGAPRGRKYVVHGVDFDGWDARRKVLLYAKLFRSLRVTPKAWGLRGYDAAVINEARRQLHAADLAGGTPIEWHIALDEPARRVTELLTEYAGIPPDRIRVCHTPIHAISGAS
jgi:hypothetical protein